MTSLIRLVCLLVLVSLVSCVETKASTSPISAAVEQDVFPAIAECDVNGVHVSVTNPSADYFELKIESKGDLQIVKITPETFDGPPSITIDCKENGFDLVYEHQVGNSYHWYIHSFVEDQKASFVLKSEFFESSDRNGIALLGAILEIPIAIKDYSGVIEQSIADIYEFTGFQEGEEPEITPFFERVKAAKDDKKKLELFSDPFVVDYILSDVVTTESTVSQFNDIAYYFEQAGYFPASIAILTDLIDSNPKRTVAYINLGDAYWGNQQFDLAKNAYKEYVSQMTEKGIEAKIPERVHTRLAN